MSDSFEIRSICGVCGMRTAMTDEKSRDSVLIFDNEASALARRDKLLSKEWELELSILGASYHECPECHVIRPIHELKLYVFRHFSQDS
jgi:RNA polymerase subunit RPABC4/transcription elongation factor Spt4